MSTDRRQFNFMSALTAIVVISYVLASAIALWQEAATWADFSGAVGPIAGLLLGYWLKGEQNAAG